MNERGLSELTKIFPMGLLLFAATTPVYFDWPFSLYVLVGALLLSVVTQALLSSRP
jgi:hypothetical protein